VSDADQRRRLINHYRASPLASQKLWRITGDSGASITIPPKWIDENARSENNDTNAGIARELKNRAD
jgi:hypothetical protein